MAKPADKNTNKPVNKQTNKKEAETDELKEQFDNLKIFKSQQQTGIDPITQGKLIIKKNNVVIDHPYTSSQTKDFKSMNVLRPQLLDACFDNNFTHPSKIQATAIPICLNSPNKKNYPNMIAQAHHGSGKTATFTLIMLQRIDEASSKLQCLCIVHSRELARQTYDVCQSLGVHIQGLKIALAIKGTNPPNPWNCQIVIGTPGTIISKYINPQKYKPFNKFMEDFKILVIDEADEFLRSSNQRRKTKGKGFGTLYDQLMRIVTDICKNCPNEDQIQTLLFSATYPQSIKKLATEIAPDAFVIKLEKKQVQLNNIKVFKISCKSDAEKFNTLLRIISLTNVGQSIVFVNTVIKAKQLVEALEAKNIGISCSALYGKDLDIAIRDKTMEEFRKGLTVCLVASNVIARGIDVPAVGLVVNFEIPVDVVYSSQAHKSGRTFDSETFMHRVGRCGRFGAKGVCVNLVSEDSQASVDRLNAIEKEYSLKIIPMLNKNESIKQNITDWLAAES